MYMKNDPKFKKIAFLVVQKAGKILKANFRKKISIRYKKDLTPLTEVDLMANEVIVGLIKQKFPAHDIFSEESGGSLGKEFTWIIDPLDGTTNYILGLPFFSVSLALLRGQEPILGIVFNPATKELYLAEKGKGAYLNQKKIRVNNISNFPRSLINFNRGKDLMGGLKILTKIISLSQIRTIRAFGSGHLELCQVALGKTEGYISKDPARYDSIAGALIVNEAGGRVTDFKGNKFTIYSSSLLVTNGKIHNQILKLINKK